MWPLLSQWIIKSQLNLFKESYVSDISFSHDNMVHCSLPHGGNNHYSLITKLIYFMWDVLLSCLHLNELQQTEGNHRKSVQRCPSGKEQKANLIVQKWEDYNFQRAPLMWQNLLSTTCWHCKHCKEISHSFPSYAYETSV